MTDIYNETYHTTVYDEPYTVEYAQEAEFYGEEFSYHQQDSEDIIINRSGTGRVIRLLLVLLLALLIVGVIVFGVIPYVEAITQSPVLLPPAVQT